MTDNARGRLDRRQMYGLLASLLLWPVLIGAILLCRDRLPTSERAEPFEKPYDPGHNWLGQGVEAFYGYGLLLLVVIYAAKFFIGHLQVRWVRVYWFALLAAASLPYIWLLLVFDWWNWHVFRFACWVHDPIGWWFIPTLSFTADTVALRGPGPLWYLGRSCFEIVVIMLAWFYVWDVISFFVLGGGWI